jgi:integrase
VATLSRDDVVAYTATRLRGGLVIPGTQPDSTCTLKPARRRSAQADLKLLVTMLRWATTVKLEDGRARWLDRNPLDGVKLPRERAPRRPVATFARFEKTVEATRQLEAGATSDVERRRWQALRCALGVAETCGRRLNAVRLLTWGDVDFTAKVIHWPAASDKAGVSWTAPLSADAAAALREFQCETGAIAGPVFTLPQHPDRVPSRHWFAWALLHAEAAAGLPKLDGGLYHPYRRKWATERMNHPLKAVATAGGWTRTDTLIECYQQPDPALLRAVMDEPRKLREGTL